MSELYDRIVSQRGRLANLVNRIPGFRGYQDKNDRRKADRLLRDYIADQIGNTITEFTRLENKILNAGGLKHMSYTREIKAKIQAYEDRVNAAELGYSGMFAQISIDTPELDKLYAFDEAQLNYVDSLEIAIEELSKSLASDEAIEEALNNVQLVAVEANDAFKLRDDVILNLTDSLR